MDATPNNYIDHLTPAFEEDSVNVILSSNEWFTPYCAAAIQSIIDNASLTRNYDIIILERDIKQNTKRKLFSLSSGMPNVSIRTLNVQMKMKKYDLYVHSHFAVETYFRLLISDLLPDYDKVLYLDCDIAVIADVADLYDTDMQGYTLAGVLDVCLLGMFNGEQSKQWVDNYLKTVMLKEENKFRYVNAGVLLMDLNAMRNTYTVDHMLQFAQAHKFPCCDQDVINSLYQGQILILPMEWNTFPHIKGEYRDRISSFAPFEIYHASREALENPKIIHYLDAAKPWHNPDILLADYFWSFLKKTPFYEIALYRQIYEISRNEIALKAKEPLINKLFPFKSRRRRFIATVLRLLKNKE